MEPASTSSQMDSRKLSAPKAEIEKAASAKRQSFMKAPHEKPAMQYDADVLLAALCKPWEMGGHTHDFLRWHRSARTSDLYQHYETDKLMIQRHERMVEEKEAWNRQRKLREDMLNLLTRLHSIERQRRKFIGSQIILLLSQSSIACFEGSGIELFSSICQTLWLSLLILCHLVVFAEKRRVAHPEDFEDIPDDYKEENANIKVGAINLANTYFQKRPSQLSLMQPFNPASINIKPKDLPTIRANIGEPQFVLEAPSPRTVALRQEVQELDGFDEKLPTLVEPAAGSAKSFPKKK